MNIQKFVHFSSSENLTLVKRNPGMHFKPIGLWLAKDDSWLFATSDMGIGCGKYKYEIMVDMTNILTIDTFEKLCDFAHEFWNSEIYSVDWIKVFEKYDGLNIENFSEIKECVMQENFSNIKGDEVFMTLAHTWFIGLDLSCCVVSNIDCVMKLNLVSTDDTKELTDE